VVAVKIVGDGRVLAVDGDGELGGAADDGGLAGGLGRERGAAEGGAVEVGGAGDVVGGEGFEIADRAVHHGGDGLHGSGLIGVVEAEDVTQLVENHAAEIEGRTADRTAVGIPGEVFVDDEVGFFGPNGLVTVVDERDGEGAAVEVLIVDRGGEENLVEVIAEQNLSLPAHPQQHKRCCHESSLRLLQAFVRLRIVRGKTRSETKPQ